MSEISTSGTARVVPVVPDGSITYRGGFVGATYTVRVDAVSDDGDFDDRKERKAT